MEQGIFKCDVCGISLNGISIVNGMHFCTKCYYETFGNMKSQEYLQVENDKKDHQIELLTNRWEKLKEWFKSKEFDWCTSRDKALAKMQEIEKE